jgi:putative endonuclease
VNLGKYGESVARDYLKAKGYKTVRENFKYARAEIDLIVKDDVNKQLVFVEVKTRRSKSFGEPEESVNISKQRQLIKSAKGFLMYNNDYADYEKRFDVIAIYIEEDKETINHLENAF